MPEYIDKNVLMENVQILPGGFRHFGGKEAMFNDEGQRNFAVALDEDVARAMDHDGWTIKWPKPRPSDDEEDTRQPFIKVKIKYGKGRPPRVVLITSRNRVPLGEDEIEMLDYASITTADLIIRPYPWGPNGRGESGISAYLQSLYVTIEEDPLERKYADLDEERSHGKASS